MASHRPKSLLHRHSRPGRLRALGNVQDYGDVWVPNEPDGWVPYRDGNWAWEPCYGWTWVGYEPWGWAPYHYGRWFPYGDSWAWWPGPVWAGYNPFWAPAYVSFWGWGGGFGFNVGFGGWGGFGWLPLGPCDWYHPWWGGYRGRFGVVNVTNVNITNIHNYGGIAPLHSGMRYSNVANFRNGRIGNAMSAVNASHFGAGRVRAMAASSQQLRGARMMAGNLPVVPTRASLIRQRACCARIDYSQWRSATLLRIGTGHDRSACVVPAAAIGSAADHAAQPRGGGSRWWTRSSGRPRQQQYASQRRSAPDRGNETLRKSCRSQSGRQSECKPRQHAVVQSACEQRHLRGSGATRFARDRRVGRIPSVESAEQPVNLAFDGSISARHDAECPGCQSRRVSSVHAAEQQ